MADQVDWQRLVNGAKLENFSPLLADERQIDRAIRLFIEESDYLCAITLAGAADSLIGEALRAKGAAPALDLMIDAVNSGECDPTGQLSELISTELTAQHMNKMRNLLKHHTVDLNTIIEHPTDLEAFNLIVRAVLNYGLLTENVTPRSAEFFAWIRLNRPEILEEGNKL